MRCHGSWGHGVLRIPSWEPRQSVPPPLSPPLLQHNSYKCLQLPHRKQQLQQLLHPVTQPSRTTIEPRAEPTAAPSNWYAGTPAAPSSPRFTVSGPAPHTARPPAPRLSRSSRVEPIASTAFPVPNIPRQLRHLPCPTLDALVPYRTAPRPPGHGPALASPLSHPSHTRPCVRRSPMQPNTIKTNNQHNKLAKPVRTHYYSHRILPLWSRAGLRAPRTTRCPTVGGLRAPHFPFT